eukprot:COSAG04_NODE_26575_length_293_cov_0.798969_1_plen_49_part_01
MAAWLHDCVTLLYSQARTAPRTRYPQWQPMVVVVAAEVCRGVHSRRRSA